MAVKLTINLSLLRGRGGLFPCGAPSKLTGFIFPDIPTSIEAQLARKTRHLTVGIEPSSAPFVYIYLPTGGGRLLDLTSCGLRAQFRLQIGNNRTVYSRTKRQLSYSLLMFPRSTSRGRKSFADVASSSASLSQNWLIYSTSIFHAFTTLC